MTLYQYTGNGGSYVGFTPERSAMVDWTNGFLYVQDQDNTLSATVIYQFALANPATPLQAQSIAGLGLPTLDDSCTAGQDGNLYFAPGGVSSTQTIKMIGSNLAGGVSLSGNVGSTLFNAITTLQAGIYTYVLVRTTGFGDVGSSDNGLCYFLVNGTTGVVVPGTAASGFVANAIGFAFQNGLTTFTTAFVRGPSSGTTGSAWSLEGTSGGTNTPSLRIRKVTITQAGAYTCVLGATILATTIDAAWTTVVPSGGVYDATDGNLVITVTGTGGSNPTYLMKVTPTGTILWQNAMPVTQLGDPSICQGGHVSLLSGSGTSNIFKVTTSTGSYTTTPTGVLAGSTLHQYVNDQISQIVWWNGSINWAWSTFGQTIPPVATATGSVSSQVIKRLIL